MEQIDLDMKHTNAVIRLLVSEMRWKLDKKFNTLINRIGEGEYELKLASDRLNDFIVKQLKGETA